MGISRYKKPASTGNKKPVFIDGIRTPFVKSFGEYKGCDALELFSRVVDAIIRKTELDANDIDEIIAGVVVPQTKNGNVARDTILNLGLPKHIHGNTINKACTSSLLSVTNAASSIAFGASQMVLAGGVESLSDVPIVYSDKARQFLLRLSKARSLSQKVKVLKSFSLKAWVPRPPSLTEPLTGLTMGQHAEIMAKLNNISQEDQDKFAVSSHQKAFKAQKGGFLTNEIIPIWPSPRYDKSIDKDNIIRQDTTLEALSSLRPVFDKSYGTITAGNSSPITDGASVALIADEAIARSLNLTPKVRIADFCYVGVDPSEQLLVGPAVAIPLLLTRNKLTLNDIDRFEIHEAFAAQVLSCLRSMESSEFNNKYFGNKTPFGTIPDEKLNVNGGAIAIGHPFGATGVRMLTTLTNELRRSDKNLGVIGICAAGGMAGAMLIERIN